MKAFVLVALSLLLVAVTAELPAADLDQLELPDSSASIAARSEDINAIPTEEMDPSERERADVYSTAVHLSNHISFGGSQVHSEASPYASLFQIQETDSRKLAEKDMQLDTMDIVPEDNDDSQAPVLPFYASPDMTEIADPLLDVAVEHKADEEEDQALDHAADVLQEDVEAGDVAELAMSAPSLVEEEELPRATSDDEATFIEMMDDDEELEEADDRDQDEEDDEDDDQHEHESDEEQDDESTEEHDDSFDADDNTAENEEAPAQEAQEAPAQEAPAQDAAQTADAQEPAAVPESAPVPADVAAPSGDITSNVQDN